MSDNSRTLVALLVGLAAGVTLGVLFAPDKGSNTRKRIANLKDDFTDELEDLYEEGKEFVKEKVKKTREAADDLKEKAKNEYEEVRSKVKQAGHFPNAS